MNEILNRLKDLKLRGKLMVAMMFVGLTPLIIAAFVVNHLASGALSDRAINQLESLREAKKNQVEQYFQQIDDQVKTFAENTMIVNAMSQFTDAFYALPEEIAAQPATIDQAIIKLQDYYKNEFGVEYKSQTGKEIALDKILPTDPHTEVAQSLYIGDNANPLGSKHHLDKAKGQTEYNRLHAEYHPIIRHYLERFGYYDIFLVDKDGRIVYSVFKELDFATSLTNGAYSNTNLAQVVRQTENLAKGETRLVDFNSYTPSYEAAASFIGSPIYNQGRFIGSLIFQMPVGRINEIMQQTTGLGETGETYLIAADKLMRSQSRFTDAATLLKQKVDTEASQEAISGKTASKIVDDYRGIPVLSAYTPLKIKDLSWSVLAEIDYDEAMSDISGLQKANILMALITIALVSFVALIIARNLANRVSRAVIAAENISKGDFNNALDTESSDEIGDLGRALSTLQSEQSDANEQIKEVISHAVHGQLAQRLEANRYEGFMQTLAQGINDLLDAVVSPLNVAAECVNKISKGDIPEPIRENYQGDYAILKNNLNTCISAVSLLASDTKNLAKSAAEGDLSSRADASRHQGDFASIVKGVNQTLDAVIQPVNATSNYIARIAKGDIPDSVKENFVGDFLPLKTNMDTCFNAVSQLVTDTKDLAQSAAVGDLSKRADVSHHQGDFASIVEGVNQTLDAVITPVNNTSAYIARIASGEIPTSINENFVGDFLPLKENLNTCIAAVHRLVTDTEELSIAALSGELSARANADSHKGEYRKIIQGINDTLESIVTPINETKQVMGSIANGDLSSRMGMNYQGDFAVLSDSINSSAANVAEMVHKIHGFANQINSSAGEIAQGNLDLSNRTERQAASLQETASTMDQLTSIIKQNAINAADANNLVKNSNQQASQGGEKVIETITAMEEIRSSSTRINDIIGVINDIAFQTNLLALNASVEAARAGEQGRGFAVVASEVGNLAQRCSIAANEIKGLINESSNRVDEGTRLVDESGEALTSIAGSVNEVATMISEISQSSAEQSAGIEQINSTVNSLDGTTQQNAALVEQAAASSQSMREDVEGLLNMLSFFKLPSNKEVS